MWYDINSTRSHVENTNIQSYTCVFLRLTDEFGDSRLNNALSHVVLCSFRVNSASHMW